MATPKPLKVEKPVKLIFAGGFLGSGKTTALAAIAKRLLEKGMKVGIVTNDKSENLVDTVIVREMLSALGVPIEEVVKGCFCCRFDELIEHIEKILVHQPDILLGEPVGSCTDFVAAVANPIKIHYHEAFRFAPFSTMVDPELVRELLLRETQTSFPEDVAYLFKKQLEEADIVVLNKIDQLTKEETDRLLSALTARFSKKDIIAVSAREGHGVKRWVDMLVSGKPGANTVLRQIDYDRYATAEAVLGWLNAAFKITAPEPFDAGWFISTLAVDLRNAFRSEKSEIGHLKFVLTSAGKSMWANLTHIGAEPALRGKPLGNLTRGSLILNARVRLDPEVLEKIVRKALHKVAGEFNAAVEIEDLQCFSPAYPEPPYVVRETIQDAAET